MRLFPHEAIPRLSLAAHSLPAPWIIPSAQVLAARFDVQRHWGGAEPIVRALVSVASEQGVPAEQQEVLRRAGLVEKDGTRLPMADLLSKPEVLRKTLLRIVSIHALGVPLWELAPAWFTRGELEGRERGIPVEARQVPGALEELGRTPMPDAADGLADEARRFLAQGNVEVRRRLGEAGQDREDLIRVIVTLLPAS